MLLLTFSSANMEITITLLSRLFTLTLTSILLNLCCVLLQFDAVAALAVTPLLGLIAEGSSDHCVFHKDESNNTVSIHGSRSSLCRFQVQSNNVAASEIEILEGSSQNYHLLVESLDVLSADCQYAYAVIDGRGTPCRTILYHQNMQITLQGNVSILLREVVSSHQRSAVKCIGTYGFKNESTPDQELPNCAVTGYHDVIVCSTQNSNNCSVDFPPNCNSTLGYREAQFRCSAEKADVDQNVIIVYPRPMYVLDAAGNGIVALAANAFQGMKELKTLLLQHNHLVSLHRGMFKDLSTLLSLHLEGNGIESIEQGSFQGLETLQEMDLSDNMLTVLPGELFWNLTDLKELKMSNNEILSLSVAIFYGLHKLEVLDLRSNKLQTLDVGLFQDLYDLHDLDIENNRLHRVDVGLLQGLNSLIKLDLHTNWLNSLDVGIFQGFSNLLELDLESNRFSALDVGLFNGLDKLRALDLDANSFSFLNVGLFNGLSNLIELDLDFNRLKAVDVGLFHGLESLEELDLDYNQLVRLEVGIFDGLRSLIYLDLDNNFVTALDYGLFKDLESMAMLWLAHNQLIIIDVDSFQGLRSLTDIYLHYNKLVALEVGLFDEMTQLAQLALSGNQIETISELFNGLSHLIALRLDGNRLVDLSGGVFHGLLNLEALHLDDNLFYHLEADVFEDLISLQKLTLQGNKLRQVDSGLLRNTVKLSILDLSENILQTIPDLSHLTHLRLVLLSNNALLRIDSRSFHNLKIGARLIVSQHEICECYVTENVTCSASMGRSPYLTCDRLLSDNVLMVMIWVIGLNALGGNALVLGWRTKRSGVKNKVQSLLMSNLAMSDLLMGVYMVMIAIADIRFGPGFPMAAEAWRTSATCKFAGALSIASSEASVFFVTLISMDRLISIKFPHSSYKFGTKSTTIAIVLVWLFSSVIGIVPSILAGKNPDFYDNSHVCVGLPLALTETFSSNITQQEVASIKFNSHVIDISKAVSLGQKPGMYFSTAVFLGVNCICYIVIVCCYASIIYTVRQSSKRAALTQEMKRQLRLTAKITAIVATDFLCWSPIIVLGILVQTEVLTLPPSVFAWAVTFVLPINSAINPYLYTLADVVSSRRKQRENEVSRLQQDANQEPCRESVMQNKSRLNKDYASGSALRNEDRSLPNSIPERDVRMT